MRDWSKGQALGALLLLSGPSLILLLDDNSISANHHFLNSWASLACGRDVGEIFLKGTKKI